MATAVRNAWTCFFSVAVLFLGVPFISFALTTSSGDTQQNPCKTQPDKKGSVSNPMGDAATGGGKDTNNTIQVSNGQIRIDCSSTAFGEKPTVTYCGPYEGCKTFNQDSQEGQKLMQISDTVNTQGKLYAGGGEAWILMDTENFSRYALSPDQFGGIRDSTIGKAYGEGKVYTYDDLTDLLVTRPNSMSIGDAANAIIRGTAELPRFDAPPTIESSSGPYPPSYGLAYPPVGLTDALPVELQASWPKNDSFSDPFDKPAYASIDSFEDRLKPAYSTDPDSGSNETFGVLLKEAAKTYPLQLQDVPAEVSQQPAFSLSSLFTHAVNFFRGLLLR